MTFGLLGHGRGSVNVTLFFTVGPEWIQTVFEHIESCLPFILSNEGLIALKISPK